MFCILISKSIFPSVKKNVFIYSVRGTDKETQRKRNRERGKKEKHRERERNSANRFFMLCGQYVPGM